MPRVAAAALLSGTALLLASTIVHAGRSLPAAVQSRERVAYASVVDKKTLQPIRDVSPDMLLVREDGVRREVLRVTPATSPLPIAVVVDNSQAAAPTITDLRRALTTFFALTEKLGPTALFTVGDRPTVLQQYTTSSSELRDAAGRLFHAPNSGATLLDAIADVSRGLARRDTDRAAIVVVTGENTEYSTLAYQQVLEPLRDSGAMLYAIVLVNPNGSLSTDEARNRATVLDRGPRESGGMRVDVLTSMSFEPQLRTFAAILNSQQRLTYARPDSLIPPERVQIGAARADLEAFGAPARGQEKR